MVEPRLKGHLEWTGESGAGGGVTFAQPLAPHPGWKGWCVGCGGVYSVWGCRCVNQLPSPHDSNLQALQARFSWTGTIQASLWHSHISFLTIFPTRPALCILHEWHQPWAQHFCQSHGSPQEVEQPLSALWTSVFCSGPQLAVLGVVRGGISRAAALGSALWWPYGELACGHSPVSWTRPTLAAPAFLLMGSQIKGGSRRVPCGSTQCC